MKACSPTKSPRVDYYAIRLFFGPCFVYILALHAIARQLFADPSNTSEVLWYEGQFSH